MIFGDFLMPKYRQLDDTIAQNCGAYGKMCEESVVRASNITQNVKFQKVGFNKICVNKTKQKNNNPGYS